MSGPSNIPAPEAAQVSVLIPVWNEEGAIGTVVRGAVDATTALGLDVECVVCVDGRTSDRSAAVAAEAGARVVAQQGRGLSGAVLQAAAAAVGPVAVVIDGDGQHDPSMLGKLVAPLVGGEADLVCGERGPEALRSGFGSGPSALWRRLGSTAFRRLASAAIGVRSADPLAGMFACRTDRLVALVADPRACPPTGYKLLPALLAATPPARTAHVRVPFAPRTTGGSHMSARTALVLIRQLAQLAARRARAAGRA